MIQKKKWRKKLIRLLRFIEDIIPFIIITILLIFDYFPTIAPSINIPGPIIILIIIGILFYSRLVDKFRGEDKRRDIIWQICLTVYLVLLFVLLPLFGGESKIGLSFTEDFLLWIVLGISLLQIYKDWRKIKRSNTDH